MEIISIPSPSSFLQSPDDLQPSSTTDTKRAPKRNPPAPRTHKPSTARPDGVTKPKQSKSRNGCVTCKAKRLKCDETKPSCQQCHRRNVECGGYKKDFKWRSFEEATFASKPIPPKAKKDTPFVKADQPITAGSPGTSDESGSTVGPFSTQTPRYQPFAQFSPHQSSSRLPQAYSSPYLPGVQNGFSFEQTSYSHGLPDYSTVPDVYQSNLPPTPNTDPNSTMFSNTNHSQPSMTTPPSFSSGRSPRLIDLLLPGSDLNARRDRMDYLPQQSDVPYQPGGFSPLRQETLQEDEDVEEVVRKPDPGAEEWVMSLPSPSLSNSTCSTDSTRFEILNSLFPQPKFHPGSDEMLMMGFDKQTCGILSVKDGPTENPWRTLVWPLAKESPALFHAISSMTAFHASKLKPAMKVEGMEHMRKSVRYLAGGIGNMRADTALATTLVLAFAESWDVHVSTGIEHLRGAKVLMKQALTMHHQSMLSNEDTSRLKFLCNTWVYMDVIARLTSVDNDESNDFATALWPSSGPFMSSTEIDPLMGCASTLFPLIGRVANLVRRVRKSSSNSMTMISQANELKALIEDWEPPTFFEPPEDPTSDIQDSLQTAEAYRWATLLYLHQAIPEIPAQPAAQLAKKVLVYLATVPLTSRAIIVHIYPLLAAGCEATSAEDRTWVEDRWNAMSQRMLIGNIDRCLEVVKEVWARRNRYEAERVRERRRAAFRTQPGYPSPTPGMKRALSAEEESAMAFFDWQDGFGGLKRAATVGEDGMPEPVRVHRRNRSTDLVEEIELEKTVRGKLHWIGVMTDWKWEVLLG